MSEQIEKILNHVPEPQTPTVADVTNIFAYLTLCLGSIVGVALVCNSDNKEAGFAILAASISSGITLFAITAHLEQQATTNQLLHQLLKATLCNHAAFESTSDQSPPAVATLEVAQLSTPEKAGRKALPQRYGL